MRRAVLSVITLLGVAAGTLAYAHPATERYIPIGKSPGVSNVKSYLGKISSVQADDSGFMLFVKDTERPIAITEMTRIYVDTGPGKTNLVGTEQDCKAGRVVEAYLHEDGTAYWIKVKSY